MCISMRKIFPQLIQVNYYTTFLKWLQSIFVLQQSIKCRSDDPRVNFHLCVMELLALQTTSLLLWFTLTDLIASCLAIASSCFQQKQLYKSTINYRLSTKQQTDTIRHDLVYMVQNLAAEEPDIALMSFQRPRTKRKKNEYWPYIHQAARNMTE